MSDAVMSNAEKARAWLKTVAMQHLPSGTRTYHFTTITDESKTNMLGLACDPPVAEGKAVDANDDWLLIKTSRTKFAIVARTSLAFMPPIGATVRITPYARRAFDGLRLDATRDNGDGTSRTMIGETVSRLPIDKATIQGENLLQMMKQVEETKVDERRRLSQVLVDAGAYLEPVTYNDPSETDLVSSPPMLQFRAKTDKHDGYLRISYDRGIDYYDVILLAADGATEVKRIDDVDFLSLPQVIVDLVDDGCWRITKVELLKPAPKLRKAA